MVADLTTTRAVTCTVTRRLLITTSRHTVAGMEVATTITTMTAAAMVARLPIAATTVAASAKVAPGTTSLAARASPTTARETRAEVVTKTGPREAAITTAHQATDRNVRNDRNGLARLLTSRARANAAPRPSAQRTSSPSLKKMSLERCVTAPEASQMTDDAAPTTTALIRGPALTDLTGLTESLETTTVSLATGPDTMKAEAVSTIVETGTAPREADRTAVVAAATSQEAGSTMEAIAAEEDPAATTVVATSQEADTTAVCAEALVMVDMRIVTTATTRMEADLASTAADSSREARVALAVADSRIAASEAPSAAGEVAEAASTTVNATSEEVATTTEAVLTCIEAATTTAETAWTTLVAGVACLPAVATADAVEAATGWTEADAASARTTVDPRAPATEVRKVDLLSTSSRPRVAVAQAPAAARAVATDSPGLQSR